MTSDLMTLADLPTSMLRPLTMSEVLAIIGAKRGAIARMINSGFIPKSALARSKKNMSKRTATLFKPVVCPMAYFDLTTGPLLSTKMRLRMIREIGSIVRGRSANQPFEEGVLRIDLPKSIADTASKMADLAAAEANVVFDPEVRGGMPVLRGTRVGVYEVADLCNQEPVANILANFPSLSASHLKQARLYASAHPLNHHQGSLYFSNSTKFEKHSSKNRR
ncbi:DUF433 domain-containing protein [uncultured Sulfitobacter sp.]|uniref:DUF433 domain-containing protein n=1 Tax=uncultured Sulfitobacter sp. TaxID=191468 RepID=UPI0030D8BEA1|tara:strand:- start:11195 stop:11857 length:663 start_codon:yes stop_codon:yes gene_type:complete